MLKFSIATLLLITAAVSVWLSYATKIPPGVYISESSTVLVAAPAELGIKSNHPKLLQARIKFDNRTGQEVCGIRVRIIDGNTDRFVASFYQRFVQEVEDGESGLVEHVTSVTPKTSELIVTFEEIHNKQKELLGVAGPHLIKIGKPQPAGSLAAVSVAD